jgi:hypothetical protein
LFSIDHQVPLGTLCDCFGYGLGLEFHDARVHMRLGGRALVDRYPDVYLLFWDLIGQIAIL